MKNRNVTADAFFEKVSEFSQKTGAVGFDSKAEYSRLTKKNKKKLLKMICCARYENFDIEYVYSVRTVYGAPSVFNFRIVFDRSNPYVKYSPYDLSYILEKDDFRCYTFAYIESADRMKAAFDGISPYIEALLPKLDKLSQNVPALVELQKKFSDAVNVYAGKKIFRPDEDDLEYYDMLDNYYISDDSFFVSRGYAYFLSGNYAKAYSELRKRKNKTYYQMRLISFIMTLSDKYEAAPAPCLSTADAQAASGALRLRAFISIVSLYIPFLALFIGLYYVAAYVIYHGALWSSVYELKNIIYILPLPVLPALALHRTASGFALLFLKKDKREYIKKLDAVAGTNKNSGCMTVISAILTVFSVLMVIEFANGYTAFYEDKMTVPNSSGYHETVEYSDMEKLVYAEGYYDIYGYYVKKGSYALVLKNKEVLYLTNETGEKTVREKIVPVLQQKGVKITTVKDLYDLDFTP